MDEKVFHEQVVQTMARIDRRLAVIEKSPLGGESSRIALFGMCRSQS